MSSLKLDGSLLEIPEERTPEICLKLAQSDGRVIKFFSDFELTQEVCLAAVTNTGYAIKYLSDKKNVLLKFVWQLCNRMDQ